MILNRTKIIATVGPACSDLYTLRKMVSSGVNAFRVNMSHGTQRDKKTIIQTIKQLKTKSGERPCILVDIAGPKIRVRAVAEGFTARENQKILISSASKTDGKTIGVTLGIKYSQVKKGTGIKINDGRIVLKVNKKISPTTLECIVVRGGRIEIGKGVNFPRIMLKLPVLTEQDRKDLRMAVREKVDWIALSFVRSVQDKQVIDAALKEARGRIPVIAKIEKWEAVQSSADIIDAFDAVMVARGDLGVETPPEQVPLSQKKIIQEANARGKPVIIATQMLESMIKNPEPTRAEVSDIANAIFDGADALLVTGETAIGAHPVAVVETLKKVILETEKTINFHDVRQPIGRQTTADAISHATCQVAQDLGADCIVTMTHSGSTARMISRYRPQEKTVALTPVPATCRQLLIVWGITPYRIKKYNSTRDIAAVVKATLIDKKLIHPGKRYVVTGGVPVGQPGTTNYLTIQKA